MQHLDEPIPSHQHRHAGLDELPELILHRRREGVFLLLAGLFLGTLAMLNILGISRFITLWELHDADGAVRTMGGVKLTFAVAVGVLPYPVTFLCTDFISELFGRRRANSVVLMGLVLNLWVMGILWLGGVLPGSPSPAFYEIRGLAFGAVTASMVAYLAAQFVDVYVFHFWKRLTRGKHLWLRNNGSTLASQIVDTVAVILVTHFMAHALPIDKNLASSSAWGVWPQLGMFIATGYAFKLVAALLDTVPFYLGTRWLVRYLRLPPAGSHEGV